MSEWIGALAAVAAAVIAAVFGTIAVVQAGRAREAADAAAADAARLATATEDAAAAAKRSADAAEDYNRLAEQLTQYQPAWEFQNISGGSGWQVWNRSAEAALQVVLTSTAPSFASRLPTDPKDVDPDHPLRFTAAAPMALGRGDDLTITWRRPGLEEPISRTYPLLDHL